MATKHTSRRALRNIQSSFFFLTGTKCWIDRGLRGLGTIHFRRIPLCFCDAWNRQQSRRGVIGTLCRLWLSLTLSVQVKIWTTYFEFAIHIDRLQGEGLITTIFVTKAATIKSYTLDYEIPCALVDDNHEVIYENSEEVHQTQAKVPRSWDCSTLFIGLRSSSGTVFSGVTGTGKWKWGEKRLRSILGVKDRVLGQPALYTGIRDSWW